jgi:4-amino-4-deoxy-L-arabinose transferase-like glycosyltransferase
MRGPVAATVISQEFVEPSFDAHEPERESRGSRAPAVLGTTMGVVTAAIYFIGAGRSVGDVDASVTVGAFVKTNSVFDPLHRTLNVPGFRFNNHPVFSLIEHAVWSAGFHSETALRVAPILFGAVAVGLLAWECARRFGVLAGSCAGAILAANPLFAFLSRELRDYSLVVLCAVSSTILLARMLERGDPQRAVRVGYVLILAIGLGTHLWFVPVLVAQIAVVLSQRKLDRRWVASWFVSVLLGSAVYVRMVGDMFHAQARGFSNASFPTKSLHLLLGDQWFAVGILAGFVAFAFVAARKNRAVVFPMVAVFMIVAFVWLVIRPQGLGPRFLIWLVPAVALSAAVIVARKPWAAVLVAVAVVAMIGEQAGSWSSASPNVGQAAAILDAGRARGLRVCGYKAGQWAVLAYTNAPPYLPPEGVAGCDLVVEMKFPHTKLDEVISAELPYVWSNNGRSPIVVRGRDPIRPLLFPPPQLSLDSHPVTYP